MAQRMTTQGVSENRRTPFLAGPAQSHFFRASRVRGADVSRITRQVASRDNAEVCFEPALAILLLSLLGRGLLVLRRYFARVDAVSARSFFLCVWGWIEVPCSQRPFRSITTLVCSLLDLSALFDHRRDQSNPTPKPTTRFTDYPP
jgi:hypothetical protein